MFAIHHDTLVKLCEINSFTLPSDPLIFFGLRGCLPLEDDDQSFKDVIALSLSPIDYTHLNCTLFQWDPAKKKIAAFPASTVPHRKHMEDSLSRGGSGTNQLLTGMYKNYKKGYHKAGSLTAHEAFRQDGKLPIRRSADDLDYDEEDRVEFVRPFDNIHASWCPGLSHPKYASAGCQVIMGYPKCKKRGDDSTHTGPWKAFHDNAYNIDQSVFHYVLLNARDALKVSLNPNGDFSPRLRYGSEGSLVGRVQRALADRNYYEGTIDDDFGPRTLFAVLDFQTATFGSDGDDGIVGPMTQEALGI